MALHKHTFVKKDGKMTVEKKKTKKKKRKVKKSFEAEINSLAKEYKKKQKLKKETQIGIDK